MDIEVKVLVPGDSWQQLRQLIPAGTDDKKREVWFFEAVVNGEPLLKSRELILRARTNRKKNKADTTAKLRRWIPNYDAILQAWTALEGFKSEYDAGGDPSGVAADQDAGGVPAWSLTIEPEDPADLFKLTDHDIAVEHLFNRHQRVLLEHVWPQLPWEQLKPLGPIDSVKWAALHELSIEQWTIAGETLFEVSKRGEKEAAAAIAADIRQQLTALAIPSSGNGEGKTAWALKRLIHAQPS